MEDGDVKVLVTGCSHCGITNIVTHTEVLTCQPPSVVIGGMHMTSKACVMPETETDVLEVAQNLKARECKVYTGHCTGEMAFQMMKDIMGDQLESFGSGWTIEL